MDFLRVILALGTVFGLLAVLYFIANHARARLAAKGLRAHPIWSRRLRIAHKPDADSLRVTRRVSLTATHQLHLIATTEDSFLLCTHPHGCTLLPTRVTPAAAEESAGPNELGRYAS